MSGKGIPIAEPINGAIFLSKSNPGPKRDAKRNKRKGVNSPFDHVNDRKKQDFRGSSSTSKTSPHFVEVASPNKSDVLLPQSADMPLLNAGLSKFTTQRAFTSFPTAHTLQGQAAINRLAASSSGQKRPVTAHGRPEPPKLKFESPQSSAKEEVQFIEPQRQTARERMHTKSASITPIPRKTVSPDRGKALASYYVEHAWSQIVGSDENFKIPLFTDARMYFYTNFIDLNFRDDSPMYGKSIRELMYAEDVPYVRMIITLMNGEKIWLKVPGSTSTLTQSFFDPVKLSLMSEFWENKFANLDSSGSRRHSGRIKNEPKNNELLNTLKERRISKNGITPEQTQVSAFYASVPRATRSSNAPIFDPELYQIPKRELRKRAPAPEPVNLIPLPPTNNEIDKFAISVREHDRHRMNEGEFLNDTAIEFYIRYLRSEYLDLKWKAFNTFFYNQYTSDPSTGLHTDRGVFYNYEKIRKWTANEDIFQNEFIFVPINEHLHWYLGVIWNPKSLLTEKDDQQESQSQEFEVLDVQPKITSHLSSSRDKQMINLGDDIEEYGKLEGGGNYSYPDPITISSEDDEDPLTNGPKTQTSRSDKAQSPDAEYCLEKEEEVDELSTDSDTPQVKETSALNLRPRVASPDLGAKQTYIAKKKVTPITGTMKKSEKERREERTRRLQEERLNRRMNKCVVIVIDSLGVKRVRPTKVLRKYLCDELEHRKGIIVDPENKAYFESIPDPKTPLQPNHCDCGVYLLQAIESIVKNSEYYRDYLLAGKNSPSDWFTHDLIVIKRKVIMTLMDKLEKEFKEKVSGENSSGSFETVSGSGDDMQIDTPEVDTQENDSDIEIIETK